jgi:hypothetical protein
MNGAPSTLSELSETQADLFYSPIYTDPGTTGLLQRLTSTSAHSSLVTTGMAWLPPITIEAAAGTYDVSVRFKTSAGTLSVKDRCLRVWSQSFG